MRLNVGPLVDDMTVLADDVPTAVGVLDIVLVVDLVSEADFVLDEDTTSEAEDVRLALTESVCEYESVLDKDAVGVTETL